MRPAGLQTKLKNNDNKHPHVHDEWIKGKCMGRPAQQFNAITKQWGKPRKVAE
jgi:hypothetical protein